ncbi:DUF1566 domain-containing protein [Vibrio tapetis subsp. quintayensis]|uniref:Lcl C-terminal domain-containing protein n=1 Tax=Vibrio tapetis TaxID=52443 RepID=UPI0025B41E4A|nr:DUF1566 domain-containing protein [Vibrio tapetis]MDN3682052.1 DUF1566 domain-containing protein [Vibrio tapetis subsp. quintayensis]
MNKILVTLLCWLLPLNVMAMCNYAITKSTPSSRFNIHGDGTVTDKQTGLTWMRCSIGQTWQGDNCTGNASNHNWQQALTLAKDHEFAGKNDWRLPNVKELASIVEVSCVTPAINTDIFSNTTDGYLTSSSYARSNSYAWTVYFNGGYVNISGTKNYNRVRLVRGGQ